jgi:alpha-beta hydrolase superfamily lysophospholipase
MMQWDNQNNFDIHKLDLGIDQEGIVEATVIRRMTDTPSNKAILYIHGFVDYFYQIHMVDWANSIGFNFYAIDLRKYGRSMFVHQKPNMTENLLDYFEEIKQTIDIIRETDNNNYLVISGHSTGGLIASLFAHKYRHQKHIDLLILNSPFFDFNKPKLFKKIALPLVAKLGLRFPNILSPEGLKDGYVKSIHKDFYGEWDFDLEYKPVKGFSINFGWISAIYYAQKRLQKGLNINCPTLVLFSSRSVVPGNYKEEMKTADAVLDVRDIRKFASSIGNNVELLEIEDGVHDLILSKKDVRESVFRNMTSFIEENIAKK